MSQQQNPIGSPATTPSDSSSSSGDTVMLIDSECTLRISGLDKATDQQVLDVQKAVSKELDSVLKDRLESVKKTNSFKHGDKVSALARKSLRGKGPHTARLGTFIKWGSTYAEIQVSFNGKKETWYALPSTLKHVVSTEDDTSSSSSSPTTVTTNNTNKKVIEEEVVVGAAPTLPQKKTIQLSFNPRQPHLTQPSPVSNTSLLPPVPVIPFNNNSINGDFRPQLPRLVLSSPPPRISSRPSPHLQGNAIIVEEEHSQQQQPPPPPPQTQPPKRRLLLAPAALLQNSHHRNNSSPHHHPIFLSNKGSKMNNNKQKKPPPPTLEELQKMTDGERRAALEMSPAPHISVQEKDGKIVFTQITQEIDVQSGVVIKHAVPSVKMVDIVHVSD
jgi:hypothetical protein